MMKSFLLITCFSSLGIIISPISVYGFNISLDNASPISDNGEFIYNYDITLDSGETLVPDGFDNLILENLVGVSNVEALSPYRVSESGFDPESASFEVAIDPAPQTNFPGVISLSSTSATVGNVDYMAFYNDSNGSPDFSSGQVLGPRDPNSSNSVPFTFSPSLGLFISASFFGVSYFKRKN